MHNVDHAPCSLLFLFHPASKVTALSHTTNSSSPCAYPLPHCFQSRIRILLSFYLLPLQNPYVSCRNRTFPSLPFCFHACLGCISAASFSFEPDHICD
jgi:hypothetical protein